MPVSSGMNIRMFPLTLEGDWTAAASKRGWVCLGGRGSGINGPTSLSHRGGCFQVKAAGMLAYQMMVV